MSDRTNKQALAELVTRRIGKDPETVEDTVLDHFTKTPRLRTCPRTTQSAETA